MTVGRSSTIIRRDAILPNEMLQSSSSMPHFAASHYFHTQEGILLEEGVFSLSPLPSINKKGRIGQGHYHVARSYRDCELQQIATLTRQREAILWQAAPTDRYAILYRLPFRTELRADLHNPIKPTCDLLGKGRWERKGKQKVFTPHAQILWDDNRVLVEMQCKVIDPYVDQHQVHLHILKTPACFWDTLQVLPVFLAIAHREGYVI